MEKKNPFSKNKLRANKKNELQKLAKEADFGWWRRGMGGGKSIVVHGAATLTSWT